MHPFVLKQTNEDPWKNIEDHFKVNDKLKGKVLYVLDKGIIFLLENDFEAILPISKINEESKHLFDINKELDLVISQINKDNRKIYGSKYSCMIGNKIKEIEKK